MQKVKKLSAKEEEALKAEQEALRQAQRQNFRRELIGIFGGIGLAMVISALVPVVRAQFSLGIVILWGGAIGGVVTSLERFERAGAALTKKDNRPLNYAVGLGIPAGILALLLLMQ